MLLTRSTAAKNAEILEVRHGGRDPAATRSEAALMLSRALQRSLTGRRAAAQPLAPPDVGRGLRSVHRSDPVGRMWRMVHRHSDQPVKLSEIEATRIPMGADAPI